MILSLLAVTGTLLTLVAHAPKELCSPIPVQTPEKAKHGWSVWQNESFKVFTSTQTPYCLEAGWKELENGVVIKTDQFSTHTLLLADGLTSINVVYSIHLPHTEVTQYIELIERTFKTVGSFYGNNNIELNGHTVLISVGIAGDGSTVERSVYPTPTKNLTVLARNIKHPRSEELFIHAVAHLYNRQLTSGQEYQQNQAPISAEDWQELEASWAEIVFNSDAEARNSRVQDLYEIHEAVQSEIFSPALIFPFNSRSVFEEVRRKGVMLGENPSYSEEEYSHYVLAPLLLVSIDGLLEENNASTSVTTLIQQAQSENTNFFALLQEHLSLEHMTLVNDFIFGRAQIPYTLLETGIATYK